MLARYRIWNFAAAFLALALFVHAAPVIGPQDTVKIADSFIIPRFKQLQSAAKQQASTWATFCAKPKAGDNKLRAAFNRVADAWAGIEFVRFGPATVDLRADRFNYWLDRRNTADDALTAMLAAPNDPTAADIAAASAAAQGLPMLERLLYPDDAFAKLATEHRRCAVGAAVAQNLAGIADAILADWTGASGARAAIAANGGWGVSFFDGTEATSILLTDILVGVEGLKDNKLGQVFHDVSNPDAPRWSEAFRSGRTLRDIELNLIAQRTALDFFMAHADAKQKADLAAVFDVAEAKLKALQAADGASNDVKLAAVQDALGAFIALSSAARTILPAASGVALGFNGLDGD
ncbi:MAG TPA: imelysin family protein [Rhizomicrobium sp.]|nr:imelysin family protein [Rhizomicrobium sp.]